MANGTRSVPATLEFGMEFQLFDPDEDIVIHVGSLPHWYQPGVTYFITFRTEDSIPAALSAAWHGRREDWLRSYGIDPSAVDWKTLISELPLDARREFHRSFTAEFMEYLDRGHGDCVLRKPALAQIVADSFYHFDGQRYHLADFVVMPNHVHLLVCLLCETEIESLCYSWKKYTAGKINRALRRTGRFWQEESFDHLVRSPEHFEYFRTYIADNPRKAGLRAGEYLHYRAK
jgi:type I restriction enzyme R subunit